ncbi:hypothetical protein SprV_0802500700 [Sparganum proliferum]
MSPHFPAFRQKLAGGEDGSAEASDSTLTGYQKSLFDMGVETVEEDVGNYLLGDVVQQDSSMSITELPVAFPLVEMEDFRILAVLRNMSAAPYAQSSVVG